MKELLKNLWMGPGSTVAGAITAGLTFIMAADVEISKTTFVVVGAVSAFLSFMAGPQKPKGKN